MLSLESQLGVALVNKIGNAIGWWVESHQIIHMTEAKAARIQAESNIDVADLKRRAEARFFEEEIKRQANMESIVLKVLSNLLDNASPNDMETDWVVNFFDKSRIVSEDKMQERWAKLLAGEANAPGSFSRNSGQSDGGSG